MGIANILQLLGGVALFLFGMELMGDNLKLVAGPRLEITLYKLTSTALKGLLLGTVVTAVVQSSSAISAMAVGFVNSGIMNLHQAIGIILGANVGTSVTGWILCLSYVGGGSALSLLSSSSIAALVAIIGILMRMTGKDAQRKHAGSILLGFAVLMYGMQAMSSAVSPLRESEVFLRMMTMFENPLLGILIGTLITAVLQSNSASVGILQALSATGAITFGSAFPMIMGMGIGAAVPVLISAIGANRDGQRTSLFYLFTGVFGTVIVSVVFYALNAVRHFGIMDMVMSPFSIAMVNTLFRVGSIVILFPFLRQLEALSGRLVPEKAAAPEKYNELTAGIERLEERFLVHPALAIEQSRVAVNSMALRAQDGLVNSFELLKNYSKKGFQEVADMEEAVDKYEDALGTYLMKISSREITERQSEDVSKYLHTIGDFERISDHSLNLAEVAREIYEKGIVFSAPALHEMEVLRTAVAEIVSISVSSFITNDLAQAARVEPLEEIVDDLCDEMKLHHIIRLQDGTCTLGQGYVFNDLLTNFERVADHCSNIAVAMIELESDSFDTHEYLGSLREMKTGTYQRYLDEYGKKFAL